MNEQQFIAALKEKGIELSETQIAQFKKYFELLVEWNEKMNLTAINIQLIGAGHTEDEQIFHSIDDAIRYLKKIKKQKEKEEDMWE